MVSYAICVSAPFRPVRMTCVGRLASRIISVRRRFAIASARCFAAGVSYVAASRHALAVATTSNAVAVAKKHAEEAAAPALRLRGDRA